MKIEAAAKATARVGPAPQEHSGAMEEVRVAPTLDNSYNLGT